MEIEKKLNYETPQIEVLEVTLEKGFAASSNPIDLDDYGFGGSWND